MIKNIIKTIAIAAIAVTLAGCAENNKSEFNANEIISSVIEENSTSSTESKPEESSAESSSTSAVESKPAESSTTTTTASKPVENPPVVSSSATASKPVEKPESSSTASKPAESKPVVSSSKLVESKPTSSTSTTTSKPVETKPVEKVHNCKTDGHVWENYTETTTEEVEIKETHTVYANGYDRDLAKKYFGASAAKIDFRPYFGTVYGCGSTKVKTTGTKTITTFYHKCTECGFNEAYNTEEKVTPGETWSFDGTSPEFYPVVWYDINNIPAEILEGREKEKAFEEDVWAALNG